MKQKVEKVYDVCTKLYEEALEEIDVDVEEEKWRGKSNITTEKGQKNRDLQEQSESQRQKDIGYLKHLCG